MNSRLVCVQFVREILLKILDLITIRLRSYAIYIRYMFVIERSRGFSRISKFNNKNNNKAEEKSYANV